MHQPTVKQDRCIFCKNCDNFRYNKMIAMIIVPGNKVRFLLIKNNL
jgi:Pyruvate/2-oxoacid:ferredoxin oxidoreductase delta subunit